MPFIAPCPINDEHPGLNEAFLWQGLPLEYIQPIQITDMAISALKRFQADESLMALAIINEKMEPLGLITRRKTLSIFGHKFSHELNRTKQADILIEENAIIMEINQEIEKISHAMTNRKGVTSFDPAVITRNGIFHGLLSVIDVLRNTTKTLIEQALDSNPLTHLPGNNKINSEINRRLQTGHPFLLAYIDLDQFKAFNDHYGYERGDRVIQLMATILRKCAINSDFIGHVGGDDFVILLSKDAGIKRLEDISNDFKYDSLLLYDAIDRQRGYLDGTNRQGENIRFQLISLSIAVVPCDKNTFPSHIEVAEVAGEVKHKAKQIAGNSLIINQRQY